MFRSLRWRLTLWFVGLTALVYLSLTLFGMVLFHTGLTVALDAELQALASEMRPAIIIQNSVPRLPEWIETARQEPRKLLATIQLYDRHGKLLEEYGPDAPDMLMRGATELTTIEHHTRAISSPILSNGKLVGFLQIQLPIILRDRSTRQFGWTMANLAPLLFLFLGLSGYIFSGIVIKPIEESFGVLRRFMADAGHELSTPISIIQVNTEALEMSLTDKGVPLNRLEVITRSTERLGSLVRDLILLGKMESPHLSFPFEPLQIEQCVQEVVEEFAESFKAKGITLNCPAMKPATIVGHSDSLRRMLTNLLQNALRYTEPGGVVTVSAVPQSRLVRVTVSDTGLGIPRESLPHIFDRFYRVDESRSRAAGGTGLGLSIVRAIAEAHQGRVEVESEPGVGSRFSVILPIKH